MNRRQLAFKKFTNAAKTVNFASKAVIVNAGATPDNLYLILEGSVRVVMEDDQGHEIIVTYLNAGEFFGEMCLFPELNTRTAFITARTNAVLAEMSYEEFEDYRMKEPDIMFEIAAQLAQRLRGTTVRLAEQTFQDVRDRIKTTLIHLCEQPDSNRRPGGTWLKISRQDLARLVGCSREMVGRVLKELSEEGAIVLDRRNILVRAIKSVPNVSSLPAYETEEPDIAKINLAKKPTS